MAITFILNDKAVNDQTTTLQTGDSGDGFTDTDVAYSSLPAAFRTYLETTLGLPSTFPTSIGVATKTNSVTVNSSAGGQLTDTIKFTDSNGGALDGDDSGLNTVSGKDIFLFADGDDTVIGKYDSDNNGTLDAIAFVIFKQDVLNAGATSAQVTFHVVTYTPIEHNLATNDPDDAVNLGNNLKLAASEKVVFSFGGTPSGDHLFTMVKSGSDGVVVTPQTEVIKLHVSQGGGPTTLGMNNQMIDPGETMVFTFVTNPNSAVTVPNLSQGEADDETNILFGGVKTTIGGSVAISQTQGNDPAGLKLTAYNTKSDGSATEPSGDGFINGYLNDQIAAISQVRVFDDTGTLVLTATGDVTTPVQGITVDFLASGEVEIRGLQDDYVVEYDAASHERLKVTGLEGKFDIGAVGIATPSTQSEFVGQQIVIEDDGPTAPTVAALTSVTHDETAAVQNGTSTSNPNAENDIAGNLLPIAILDLFNAIGAARGSDPGVATKDNSAIGFAKGAGSLVSLTGGGFGTDGQASSGATAYALSVTDGTFSGLSTTEDTRIFLYKGTGTLADLILGRVGTENGVDPDTADPIGKVAFALTVDSDGTGYIAQYLSLNHGTVGTTPPAYDDQIALNSSAVQITVTYTDRDGDSATSTPVNVGDLFKFQDDGPRITVAAAGLDLDNAATPITGTTDFGYDLGSDDRPTYSSSSSDFVDSDGSRDGRQLGLSGTVGTGPDATITNAHVDLTSESSSGAAFGFTFDYDTDPLTSGVQAATATGTLSFDKDHQYTVTLDDPISGFSFDVLHTSELLEKNPTGNTGHPPIVVEKLANDFFVQFTADTTPLSFSFTGDENNTGDTAFGGTNDPHDLAGGTETWVSATQSTNGVAGDTIQKGELLTLRFFGEDILSDATPPVTEKTNPTTTADGIAVKFDGIGNSEDLIVTLDLIDDKGDADPTNDVEITKAILVDNGDIIKKSTPGGVPAPYNSEFTLDNNDGLVIIESNDYNAAGEHYQIQGVQIMQSANGLTGNGINLNGATGAGGRAIRPALNRLPPVTPTTC
jgi:hypothetical protein